MKGSLTKQRRCVCVVLVPPITVNTVGSLGAGARGAGATGGPPPSPPSALQAAPQRLARPARPSVGNQGDCSVGAGAATNRAAHVSPASQDAHVRQPQAWPSTA